MEEYSAPKDSIWFKVKSDGEVYFVRTMEEKLDFDDFESAQTLTQLLEHEVVEIISPPSSFPVEPSSYIKGDKFSHLERPEKSKECTFYNGLRGAGVAIGLLGDGNYPVHAEYFDGRIIRITIEC